MFDMLEIFNNLTLEYPYVLLLILLFIVCAKFCKAKIQSFYMPHLNIYKQSTTISSGFVAILKWTIIISSIVALSSPIKELQTIYNNSDGIDIVLALDTSGSMRERGFNPSNLQQNRWDIVQELSSDFIKKRINDNIAIAVFGSAVMIASPLSFDKEVKIGILKNLGIGIVGDKTALIDSMAKSINILKESKAKSKIIIVLSDGQDTSSKLPLKIVKKLAKKYNIKIYTISIGGYSNFVLKDISSTTNGKYFNATSKEQLNEIYKIIDDLEKTKIEQEKIVLKEYYFFFPLFLAILCFILYMFLTNKRGSI